MKIKVLSVDKPQSIQKGKSQWEQMDVSYKNLETGKISGKTLISFKYPEVWKFFKEVDSGTEVNVHIEKIGEFWHWTGTGDEVAQDKQADWPSKSVASPSAAPTSKYVNRDYETAEERAWRQILIVRQSSVSNAIASLRTEKAAPPSLDAILAAAAEIENWVNRNKAVQALVDLNDDIPE